MKITERISRLKSSAKHRGIPVRLMAYEYENLLELGCHFCGKDIRNDNGVCLDRLDSDKGYTLENVVPCCKICNVAKNDQTVDEFLDWIERAYKFQQFVMEQLKKEHLTAYSYSEEKKLHKATRNKKNSIFINYKIEE